MAKRYDAGQLGKAELLSTGWLRAPVHISRTGIQTYRKADGTITKELRLPEEVFSPEALKSFAMVPLTMGHPVEDLNDTNVAQYQVGQLGDSMAPDGDRVAGHGMVTKQNAVTAILEGTQELSAGYHCDMEETPGLWHGEKYDAIQRNIRGNHVAIVEHGRAGSSVKIHLDEADALEISNPQEHGLSGNEGVEQMTLEEALKALEELKIRANAAEDSLQAAKKDADQHKGRADSAERLLENEKKLRLDATDPTKVSALVKARVALLGEAAKLAPALHCDALSDAQVRVQALETFDASYKELLKDKSEEYICGVFAAATRDSKGPSTIRVDMDNHFFSRTDAAATPSDDPVAQFEAALAKQQERMR